MSKKKLSLVLYFLLFALAGQVWGQTDGQYVIKKIVASGDTEVHYLAHVYNTSTSQWELQDATTFSPNCLWYSGPTFNLSGDHHNYYFFDGTNYRFLSAPLAPREDLGLSASLPETSDLKNTDEVYYFYDWDGGGLARGHEDGGTGDWICHWVSYSDHYSQWMTTANDYYISDSCAMYREVTVTPHLMEVTYSSGGLSALTVPHNEMNHGDGQQLTVTVDDYDYTYEPAYTTYEFEGVTHNYYNNTDLGAGIPATVTSNDTPASSYLWKITGEGASYLSLDDDTSASPTLTYSNENTTGHKTATITVTVTFGEGAAKTIQTLSASVLVKTSCQNPEVLAPMVTFEDVTLSWYPTAEKYKVEWRKQGTSSWNVAEVEGATSYTLTALENEATYEYRVTAYCGGSYLTPPSTPSTFTTNEEPSLLVYGAVFGGGRMADVDGNTEVVVINCQDIAALYGGNDIAGKVNGANGSKITVGVSSGDSNGYDTYGTTNAAMKLGSVYGGGNGYYAYNGSSFEPATSSSTSVSVDAGASVKAMTPAHTVGDAVWTNNEATAQTLELPSIVKTSITVNEVNYQIKADSIFGGAKNAFLALSTPDYETDGSVINIKGGTIYAVFGGNNFGGTQSACTHRITIDGTDTNLTPNIASTSTTGYGRDFGIRYVFGGGNKVEGAYTDITVNGGQTDTIFAGGNSADVVRGLVRVNCSLAAGSGATFGHTYSNAISSTDGSAITVKDDYAWNGTGIYNVRALFGGNNKAATTHAVPSLFLTSGSVGTVYGGGNAGDMEAHETTSGAVAFGDYNITIDHGTHVEMNSPTMLVDYLYGGCQVSNVDYSTWVEIKDGHVGTVYGGCNISGDVGSTRVYPSIVYSGSLSNEDKIKYQTVQGATYVKATGGTIHKALFAGSNGYYHCNDGIHYVSGMNFGDPAYDPNELYVGLPVPTHNETYVYVSEDVTVKGNVYAGGNLACVGYTDFTAGSDQVPQFVGWASVQMDGGTVEGDVYGGGNMASVYGSNEVKVSGGTIGGGLYGGNDRTGQVAQITNRVIPSRYDYASDGHTSLSKVKTYVSLTGAPNINTVYGGGNGAYDYTDPALQFCGQTPDKPLQSNTFVDINIDPAGSIDTVYGGGNGVTVLGTITVFLNVNGTTSTQDNVGAIFGGNNMGDLTIVPDIYLLHGQVGTVYGGCNQGAMLGKKTVESYADIGSYVRLPHQYTTTDNSTNPPTTYTDNALTAMVTSAIYGGCRMNGVSNNTLVLIEKGDLQNVDIFGGCDISGTVSGTSHVVTTAGEFDNLYGGGNGNYNYVSGPFAGLTPPHCVNTMVDMIGGTADGNVYAGGYAGTCGDTYVVIEDDGRVEGSVFGGGNEAGVTHTSTVALDGGTVLEGIYGGCNSSGDIGGDITVNIVKGNVGASGIGNEANIHGGGYGDATSTSGDVTVNIGVIDAASADVCPVIYGDVYGGSALGSVNASASDQTTVNFLNGTLQGNIYGGGLGDPSDATKGWVKGQVVVNIGNSSQSDDHCFIDLRAVNVFGCNNTNGSPQDNVTVNIYKTAHNYSDYPTGDLYTAANGENPYFAINQVFGGGNAADYLPENGLASSTKKATVNVFGCDNTISRVFGGGNAAASTGVVTNIEGGRFYQVFGGGNGELGPDYAANIGSGGVGVNVTGGIIHQLFGGSNANGDIGGTLAVNVSNDGDCPEVIDEIFSGSNHAPLYGDIVTNLVGDCYDPLNPTPPDRTSYYGGTNLAPIYGNVELNVYGGYYVNVFGGSKGYYDPNNPANNYPSDIRKFPTVTEIEDHPENYQPDPDGLKAYIQAHPGVVGTGGNVTLNLYGGKIVNAFGGSDVLGNIEGKITVNVLEGGGDSGITHCALDLDTVYGGGNEAAYTPTLSSLVAPEVNVVHGTVSGTVFGGGLGTRATVTANPKVTIGDEDGNSHLARVGESGSTTKGYVYGGGNMASVDGNTTVLIRKANTIVNQSVFGGGKGSDTDVDVAQVKGNATVTMSNGSVGKDIYGGGEIASVGTFTRDANGDPTGCTSGGKTTVNVSGGSVGPDDMAMPTFSGMVFGAGMGIIGDTTVANGNPLITYLNYVNATEVNISGTAFIKGSVYGGSKNGHVLHNTLVQIEGGQIGNGQNVNRVYTDAEWESSSLAECAHWPYEGEYLPYDPYAGDPLVQSNPLLNGSSTTGTDGHTYYGNVFGGGSGNAPYAPGQWNRYAGRVQGNTEVRITGGHILTSVYGGNECTDVVGTCTVSMSGGTVGVPRTLSEITNHPVTCSLYGAGKGDQRTFFNKWTNVAGTTVTISGSAHVYGSVFGGGEDGHVEGDVSTTISGGTIGTIGTSGVDGNVFGGGRGFSATALTAGVVTGNVTLSISDGNILGSVYGGGRLAAIGTYLVPPDNVLYGSLQDGDDHGNITITITGGTIGNEAQMNNSNGNSIGDVFGGSRGTLGHEFANSNQRLGLSKNTTVNISQAAGKTTTIYGNVYGGGGLASVGNYTYATADDVAAYNTNHPTEPLTVGDVYSCETGTGLATVLITGGTIGLADHTINNKGQVFGSCLGQAGSQYSGYSFVNNSSVTISGTAHVYGSVFGGGENGHVLHDTHVTVEGGFIGIDLTTVATAVDHDIYNGNVYGGGRGIDTYNNSGTQTYSLTAGKVSGNSNVSITGGTVYRNVYGGGSLASVGDPDEIASGGVYSTGKATVSISGTAQIGTDGGWKAQHGEASFNHLLENGHVFGSGRGMAGDLYMNLAYVKNSDVTIDGTAYVTGSVFGGGENGHVRHDTKVTVNDGTIGYPLTAAEMVEDAVNPVVIYRGNVYGGGRGIDHVGNSSTVLSETAGVVYGNTEVNVNGGTVRHNVYGGGSLASVGTISLSGSTVTFADNTGEAHVNIKGTAIIGTSGVVEQEINGTLRNVTIGGINNGRVYGSGRGMAGATGSQYVHLAYVNDAFVTIGTDGGSDNPQVLGSVFGGGENGHVKGDTHVNVYRGTIGTALASGEDPIDAEIYRGNVYGGGRGVDHISGSTLSTTAGIVEGNTHVAVSGGLVRRNIYGGGSLARVGNPDETPQDDGSYLTGKATVTINGTAQIGTDGGYNGGTFNHLLENGHVFGSGRGVAGTPTSQYIELAYVKNTDVTIGGTAYVTGSVFGGGENGHVRHDTKVTVTGGGSNLATTGEPYPIIGSPLTLGEMVENVTSPILIYRGNVYGGGRGIDHINNGTQLSETAGIVGGNTNIFVQGGTIRHNVYGGGSLARVGDPDESPVGGVYSTGHATIDISGGQIGMSETAVEALYSGATGSDYSGHNNGQVYGSGRGVAGAQYAQLAYVKYSHVNISGGAAYGSVFGGGENGHVRKDTEVNISGGTIGIPDYNDATEVYRGNVYGGGRGIDNDEVSHFINTTEGVVKGNANLHISGGTIYHNVYGGGSLASVGDISYSGNTVTGIADGTGTTTIVIDGGQIGINGANNGRVFGSGRGVAGEDSFHNDYTHLTYVNNTYIQVNNGADIKGCVFGSGDNGHTFTDTHVTMTGGTIGHDGSTVDGSIFGGGRGQDTYGGGQLSITAGKTFGDTYVTMTGGTVKANIYGGGNMSSVAGTAHVTLGGNAIIGTSTYPAGGNVFGASLGNAAQPTYATVGNTQITIGSEQLDIQNNVYGGGEKGAVLGTTEISIAEATLNDVYGAGKGTEDADPEYNADVCQSTKVTMTSGTVNGSVYGGGEYGSVGIPHVAGDAPANGAVSTVSIEGGHVKGSTFGGGNEGFNKGSTYMNLSGNAIVDQNVFGGAYGSLNKVYVAGLHTVNMRGGTVYGNVYGGSRNADDALVFTGYSSSETRNVSVVNISGGHAVNHVFASGYFGKAYGSVHAFIGTNAIMNAPNNTFNASDPTYNQSYYSNHTALIIDRDVWAGADYGDYTAGQFGDATISGESNIYVDGLGYDTENALPTNNATYNENQFMVIRNSIYGCGTSCDAGKKRMIMVRNYGHLVDNPSYTGKDVVEPYTSTTRDLYSIQRADTLVIEGSHLHMIGQGKVNSFSATEKYSIHEFNRVRVVNNSSVFIEKPFEQMKVLGSYSCTDVYADHPKYTPVNYDDLDPAGAKNKNKIRINQGTYVSVVYRSDMSLFTEYGQLEGFFFIMTELSENAFAFARPKQSTDPNNSAYGYNNPDDGGFVSYHVEFNLFDENGGTVTLGVQVPYENHVPSRSGEDYFRVWRYSDNTHVLREGVLNAIVDPSLASTAFLISEPTLITLPPSKGVGSYYRIKVIGGTTCDIIYGSEYQMLNSGMDFNEEWIYADKTNSVFVYNADPSDPPVSTETNFMQNHPNNAFGLVAEPIDGLFIPTPSNQYVNQNKDWLICNDANSTLVGQKWYNDNVNLPAINFYLTYSNAINTNNAWDPVTIIFEQYDSDDHLVDEVEVRLTITTITDIEQTITSTVYALMDGHGEEEDQFTSKIILPPYSVINGVFSEWELTHVKWTPSSGFSDAFVSYAGNPIPYVNNNDKFAMTLNPSLNFDNSNGWHNNPLEIDPIDLEPLENGDDPITNAIYLGETDGRNPISLNMILHFDGSQQITDQQNATMGYVQLKLHFDNKNENGSAASGELTINVEVKRKGNGTNFYIDGVNGDLNYSGNYPNAAKPNLASILYFTDFEPGDIINIVNTVTVESMEERTWNGQIYDQLVFYRYNGGHPLFVPSGSSDVTPYWHEYDTYHSQNEAFRGSLIDVRGKMSISSVVLDGAYGLPDQTGNNTEPPYADHVISEAPLINVESGGELTLFGGTIFNSELRNNYNQAPSAGTVVNAGAINIGSGGIVKINNYVYIEGNCVENVDGGGIYLENGGTLLLSDLVTVNNNKKVTATGQIDQNVYLDGFGTNIQIGTQDPTDIYESLDATSKVGITKTDWNSSYYYMPVLYGENGEHLTNLHYKDIVFDDQGIYRPEFLESADPAVADPDRHLFFVETWTTYVRTNPNEPDVFDPSDINTPEKLAWAISIVNGLNGQTAAPATDFTITGDIDMSAKNWDVIGNTLLANDNVYSGVFEGNGHTIKGIHSELSRANMGMFGKTKDATIKNLIVETAFENGLCDTIGGLIGTMDGGVVSNIETRGALHGTSNTKSIGGMIGSVKSGMLHSSFAVNTIKGSLTSVVGGLVGINNGNLFNAFSNISLHTQNASTQVGGLAGNNTGTIENCYVQFQGTEPGTFGWFAYRNTGTIASCYSPTGKTRYLYTGTGLSKHGNYGAPANSIKHLDYLYRDNIVTLASGQTSEYVPNELTYLSDRHTFVWPGMLSVLNQWVKEKNAITDPSSVYYDKDFVSWFRPITANINHDLPVLGLPMNNAMATLDAQPDLLEYGDLDGLLSAYNAKSADASIFLYGNAVDVANVPAANGMVKVSINEDAVLLQASTADAFTHTTVGVTFDNSSRSALHYYGGTLEYDWHLMSTPLSDAKVGATYNHKDGDNYTPDLTHSYQESLVDINSLEDSYFPNGLTMGAGYDDGVKWDFYCYYEPEYHWINLKRNKNNHFHSEAYPGGAIPGRDFQWDIDWPYKHYRIDYSTPTTVTADQSATASGDAACRFVPGKGYMMAISKESYMNSTGTLNRGEVEIRVTNSTGTEIPHPDWPGWPSYDWGSNLVGNPYQAYLDLDLVSTATVNPGLDKFWVYDADVTEGAAKGLYKPYTKGASENPDIPSRYLHPHQGFFVVSSSTQDMTFHYTMATDKSNEYSYYRKDDGEQPAYPLVNLYVRDTLGNADLAIVEFQRPELGGVPKIDNLRNAEFSLYARYEGKDYGLLFTPIQATRVPLCFKTPNDGPYTLSWKTYNGTFSSMFLIDNITGEQYDMLSHDSYTFDALATDYATRFYIVFSVTDVDEHDDTDGNFAYYNGYGWVVEGQGQLELVDMLGRVLYTDYLGGEQTLVHFDGLAAGMYLLRLVDGPHLLKAQKIIIRK